MASIPEENTQKTIDDKNSNAQLIAEIHSLGSKVIAQDKGEAAALDFRDKIRLISAGLLMDFGDEAESLYDTIVSPADGKTFSQRYAEHLERNQRELAQARDKDGSLKWEVGGAVIPAALTMIPTGGGSVVATGARLGGSKLASGIASKWAGMGTKKKLATVGGGQGAVVSVGKQEDADILSRVDDLGDLARTGKDAAFGAGGAIVGGKGLEYGAKLIGKIFGGGARKLSGELQKKVENEVQRLALSSNKSVDQIVKEIESGKIIPEIDPVIAEEIRGFVAKSTEGGGVVTSKIRERASDKSKDVFTSAQQDLAPETLMGNVKKYYRKTAEELSQLESANYKKIFDDPSQSNINYDTLGETILDIAKNRPDIGKEVETFIRKAGLGKLFIRDKSGEITGFARNINLETAENVKRALMGKAGKAYKSGDTPQYRIYKDLENALSQKIDEISPELAKVRNNWSKIKSGQNAYLEGTKALSKTSDDIELIVDDIIYKMKTTDDPKLLENFRLGVVSALRAKAGSANTKSFIAKLANDDQHVRTVLQQVYPKTKWDDILHKIDTADASLMANRIINQGSPTAKTLIGASKVGTEKLLKDDVLAVASTITTGIPTRETPNSIKRIVSRVLPTRDLSEDQMLQVGQILISENPQLVLNALTSITARRKLFKAADKIATFVSRSGASVGAIQASGMDMSVMNPAFADEIDPSNYKYVQELAGNIKPKVKEKLLKITIDTPKYITMPDGKVQINPQWQKQQDQQQAIIDE